MFVNKIKPSFNIIPVFLERLKSLQNFIYPFSCLECDTYLSDLSGLCGICAKKLDYILENYCSHCGLPFDMQIGHTLNCASCFSNPPQYTQARSIFHYSEGIKKLILQLKYTDSHHIVPFLAHQMAVYIHAHDIQADFIIPVPSHFLKIWHRTYNPIAVLVDEVQKINQMSVGMPALMEGLKRIKNISQKNATKIQRENHLKNAFLCPDFIKPIIKNKDILLVDDVMTTGATLNSCTKTLLKAGVKSVKILTLARVTMINHSLDIDF
jgi:ComF family protein